MTREEAAEVILDDFDFRLNHSYLPKQYQEAFNMAISALKQTESDVEILSNMRNKYNIFDKDEKLIYYALSEAIMTIKIKGKKK